MYRNKTELQKTSGRTKRNNEFIQNKKWNILLHFAPIVFVEISFCESDQERFQQTWKIGKLKSVLLLYSFSLSSKLAS